jgi:hypothetical protein
MRNSPRLPLLALVLAAALAVLTVALGRSRPPRHPFSLHELEIGFVAWALTLAVYGAQGIVSVITEGLELRPGRVAPRLTPQLSVAMVVLALLLLGDAVVLSAGLVSDWRPKAIGLLAGAGCLDLALLLVLYKEAFVGDEACLDEIDDGTPW